MRYRTFRPWAISCRASRRAHGVASGRPRTRPTEIIDRLNHEINAGLADPKIKARIAELGGAVLVGSPADFSKLIADETEKWGKVIKFAEYQAGVIRAPAEHSITSRSAKRRASSALPK